MPHARRFRLAAGLLTAFLPFNAAAQTKDCRGDGTPPGARSAQKSGCATAPAARPKPDAAPALRAGQRPGFIDLGGGTEIRIGGRARLDMDRSDRSR